MTPVTRADQVSLEHGLGTLVASCEKGEGDKMGSGSCCFGPKFVLAAAIAAGLILALAQTTQARAQACEEAGIVTIRSSQNPYPRAASHLRRRRGEQFCRPTCRGRGFLTTGGVAGLREAKPGNLRYPP